MQLVIPHRQPLTLDQPRIMGILNVTPDSFSDGGRFFTVETAVARGLAMAATGASIIDVGGESTRPGASRCTADQQNQRVLPVIRTLRKALDQQHPHVLISIDTTLTAVAEPAIDAGASILNDISAGTEDADMFALAAKHNLPIVLMHMQGKPATMQANPHYDDVVAEVRTFLLERAEAAQAAGVARSQIVIDPGIGFGKTTEHDLTLLAHLDALVATGYPVMLAVSRKKFIRSVWPSATEAADRLPGTLATTTLGTLAGVSLFRVHDVTENAQAAAIAHAVRQVEA